MSPADVGRPIVLADKGLPDNGRLPETGLPDILLPDTGLPESGRPDPLQSNEPACSSIEPAPARNPAPADVGLEEEYPLEADRPELGRSEAPCIPPVWEEEYSFSSGEGGRRDAAEVGRREEAEGGRSEEEDCPATSRRRSRSTSYTCIAKHE